MLRFLKNHRKTIVIGFIAGIVLAIAAQATMVAASAASAYQGYSAKKLEPNKSGRPGVKVTTGNKPLDLMVQREDTDFTSDDFVRQEANTTKSYRLPVMKKGTSVKYVVVGFDPKTTEEVIPYKNMTFNYYQSKTIKVSLGSCGSLPTMTVLEIKPKNGGKLKVKSVVAKSIDAKGKIRKHSMIRTSTEDDGTQVFNRDIRPGLKVTQLKTRSVNGTSKLVAANCVGG